MLKFLDRWLKKGNELVTKARVNLVARGVQVPLLPQPTIKTPNRPNYRRRQTVFRTLDEIRHQYGYRSLTQMQNLVGELTGTRASRRICVEWKEARGYRLTRRQTVFAALDNAWANGWRSYEDLKEFVKDDTGKACGSALILSWKKARKIPISPKRKAVAVVAVVAPPSGDRPDESGVSPTASAA